MQIDWRLTIPVFWAGPSAAALCGFITAATGRWDATMALRAALVYFLADPLLGAVWSGAAELSAPCPTPAESAADRPQLPALPYALAGSPGERLRLALESAWQRCRDDASWASAIGGLTIGSAFALLLAALAGATIFRLALAAIVLAGLGALVRPGAAGRARLRVLLPLFWAWLVAHAAFSPLTLAVVALAGLYALAAHSCAMLAESARWQRWAALGNVAQLLALAFLAFLGRPLYAGTVGLLLAAQGLLQPALFGRRAPGWRWSGLFLLASMLAAALGLAR